RGSAHRERAAAPPRRFSESRRVNDMKTRSFALSALSLAIVLAIASSSHATVIVPATLTDLVRESRSVARGRIAAVEAKWNDDERTIETEVTLDVETYLKGPLGPTVQFRVPGGTVGRLRRIVVGAPEFELGERVVIFLGAQGPTVPYVIGLSQGVFRIVATGASGAVVVPPPLVPTSVTAAAVVRGDPSRRPMPLADFEHRGRELRGRAR